MAYTDRQDVNYLGILYLVGAYQTPFLNMIGGLNGGGGKTVKSFLHPIAQPYNLTGASQATVTEAGAVGAASPVTVTRGQDYNTCQIMKKDVQVSFAKQSTVGEFSGIQVIGNQPVMSEFDFQKNAQLRQLAIDLDWSYLQGTYVASDGNPATNQTMRGIIEACATNTVAAGSVDLSKALVDEILRTMAANGAIFENIVVFCNAFQKQMFSDIYGYAPTDRNVGGVDIKQVETDFGMLGIVYAPNMPAATVLVAEMSVISPVFCTVPAMEDVPGGAIVFVDVGITAASKSGFWYLQPGLDYGPEEYSGTITGLTTS